MKENKSFAHEIYTLNWKDRTNKSVEGVKKPFLRLFLQKNFFYLFFTLRASLLHKTSFPSFSAYWVRTVWMAPKWSSKHRSRGIYVAYFWGIKNFFPSFLDFFLFFCFLASHFLFWLEKKKNPHKEKEYVYLKVKDIMIRTSLFNPVLC